MLKPIPQEAPEFEITKVRPVKKNKTGTRINANIRREQYKENKEHNIIRSTAMRLLKFIALPTKSINHNIIGEMIAELQKIITHLQKKRSKLVSESIKSKKRINRA